MEQNKEYIRNNIAKGVREDGRKPGEMRDVKVETGVIEKAEGSARVRIGKTEVIVGVKIDVGTPFSDRPEEGVLMTGVELSPLGSPEFEPGPPRGRAVELSRVVDRGIRESGAIEVDKLCIEPREKVWMVFIDGEIINNDGNLFDAVGLAAAAAVNTARMPKLNEDGTVDYGNWKGKLPVTKKPVPVTVGLISGKLVLDPTADEEEVVEGTLTMVTMDNGNFCAMQKSGSCEFTEEQVLEAAEMSAKVGKGLRKLVK